MKKKFFLGALLILICQTTFAQYQKILKDDALLLATLSQVKFGVDTDAKAVCLYKKGNYSIVPGTTFTDEVIIKILSDDAAKELSWINIPKGKYSVISNIKGETYNLENGKVVVQKMESNEVKRENIVEDLNVFKFNMPSVKKGSIIHYSYKRFTQASVFIPDWYAQEDYPILFEEFGVSSPGTLTEYHKLERFFTPFTVLKNPDGLDTCAACSYSEETGTGFYIKWVRRNVPGFNKEPFMESEDNYKERIRLQYVNRVTDWNNFNKTYIMGEGMWVGDSDNPIASTYKNNPFFDDKINEITSNCKNDLEKAKVIYGFVRDSFNIKDDAELNLKTIFKTRTGSSAGINMVLSAMLIRAKLNAEPAYITTRENEKLNPYYQQFQDVNFFFTRLTINNNSYNLDASKKEMPFGLLPKNAYNGYARTANQKAKEFNLEPNDIKNKTSIIISIKPSEGTNELTLKGDYKIGEFDAFSFRKKMKNDTSAIRKQIIQELSKDGSGFELTEFKIDNLNNPDAPLMMHIKAKSEMSSEQNIIYFDPFFEKLYDKNPFAASTRQYPIQMDYLEDKNVVFSFQLPKGYVLDDYPKSILYKYDDSASLSLTNMASFDASQNVFSLNSRFVSKTTTFLASDYDRIREFYNKVIESQHEKMVLKATNK